MTTPTTPTTPPAHIFTKEELDDFLAAFAKRLDARLDWFNVPTDSRDTIHKFIAAQVSRSIKVSPPPAVSVELKIDMAAIAADIAIAALRIEMDPPMSTNPLPGGETAPTEDKEPAEEQKE